MKPITIILIFAFEGVLLAAKAQVSEQRKFEMFCSAINNTSTSPNYAVVMVKNKKTGKIREICAEAPFIEGAIGLETGNWTINRKDLKTRYFEFSKDSALSNLNFDLYTKAELNKFARTFNIASIVQNVKTGKLTSITFTAGVKEQIMFAHLMFNNGVMMTRGCVAGNLCNLTYFKSNR